LPLHAQSGTLDAPSIQARASDIAVYSIVLQTNGQILIGGDFTSFDDVERITSRA